MSSQLRLAAVALGSNQGERETHLRYAIGRLGNLLTDLIVSSFIETTPEGGPPQREFLNAAVVGVSRISPTVLLKELLSIEGERGRERPFNDAPRTLDLDLILVGDLVVRETALTIPHPRFRERRFVLEPLASIAPDLIDPVTKLTIRDLLSGLDS
jgi:2-amino-4-hydroxy-6-hydroxymethyldihydropteridine diphosphokinase